MAVPPAASRLILSGKCLCGQVQISVRGEPLRVGICHCTDCRQESGSAFTFYGIWAAHQFERVGETGEFRGRHFCPGCGSRLFSADDREAEIARHPVGSTDRFRAELRALGQATRAVATTDRGGAAVRGGPAMIGTAALGDVKRST